MPRRDGHAVAETEAAQVALGGMVAGRPHEPEAVANPPLAHGRDLLMEDALNQWFIHIQSSEEYPKHD